MIEMGKTYRTRDGREVRIYAVDGVGCYPVHGAVKAPNGWVLASWTLKGTQDSRGPCQQDLIEADPHGILPRHRELLAGVYQEAGCLNATEATSKPFNELASWTQSALIALARLEKEKGDV